MFEKETFPKVDGNKAWLTQAITMNINGTNTLIKAVFVGVQIDLESVWARMVERQTISFDNDSFSLKVADLTPEVVARVATSKKSLRNSPHSLFTVVNPNAISLIGKKYDLPGIVQSQLKERGVPYLPVWNDFLMPEMEDWFTPLFSFNVSNDNEAIYFCKVPSKELCFEKFAPFMTELKIIAEKELQ